MYVLVDFEWVENAPGQYMPAQLAAMRVDEAWNTVSSFSSLCRPHKTGTIEWNHVAFSGSQPADFWAAPSAVCVFSDFCAWLLADDILLWWDEEPLQRFAQILRDITKQQIANKNLSVREVFKHVVHDGIRTTGHIYKLVFLRGIPLLSPAHDSRNDVRMFQALLKHVGFKSELLYTAVPAKMQLYSTKQDYLLPYQLDVERNIVHKKECVELSGAVSVKGGSKLVNFIKSKAKPCPVCCKSEWMETLRGRNEDIMKRSECHFFFLPTGRAFHKPTCCLIQNAIDPPRGVMYYHTAVAAGYSPCKRCKPTPDETHSQTSQSSVQGPTKQERTDNHFFPGAKPGKRKKSIYGQPLDTTAPLKPSIRNISLTWAEQQAIKRYEQASKERRTKKEMAMDSQESADFYTLTATRYAFWAAQGYSNFHKRNCARLNGLKDLKGFARFSDAVRAGYQPCRHCRPTEKDDAVLSIPLYNQIRNEETIDDIIVLCREKGYQCAYDHPEMIIETPVGRWIVNVVKRPVFVEHQHKELSTSGPSALHWQHRMFLSLTDVVLYIEKHDGKLMNLSPEDPN